MEPPLDQGYFPGMEPPPPPPPPEKEETGPDPEKVASELQERWNALEGVRKCCGFSGKRMAALKKRLEDPAWWTNVPEALERIQASRFCRGENDRTWLANMEWFLRPDTVLNLLEGKHDNRPGSGGRGGRYRSESDPTDHGRRFRSS